MASGSPRGDITKLFVLALCIWLASQAVRYAVQVGSVRTTLTAQMGLYQQRGEAAYRAAVIAELRTLGVRIDEAQLATVEDRPHDEFRAELHYEWPLRVLVFTFPRPNVARARVAILDG